MTMDGMTLGTDASSKVIEEYKCSQHLAIFSLLNVLVTARVHSDERLKR